MAFKILDISAFIITCISLSASVILNIAGIYILRSLRRTRTNQKICLINMSVAEIFTSLTIIVWRLIDFFSLADTRDLSPKALLVFRGAVWYFYFVYLMSPFPLTLGRLIGIMFPLRHNGFFSEQKATIVALLTWVLAVFLSIPFAFIHVKSWLKYAPLAALSLEIIVILFAVGTYSYIGVKVRYQRNLVNRLSNDSKVLKVALLITVTFFFFVVVSDISIFILASLDPETAIKYMQIIYSFSNINCMIDPIIYLWGYKPLRDRMRKVTSHYRDRSSYATDMSVKNSTIVKFSKISFEHQKSKA